MIRQQILAAVAACTGKSSDDYTASNAPKGSIHEDIWYVCERDPEEMSIDDCVWFVLPNGAVTRAIPVGNPIHEPTPLNWLHQRGGD
jgi:hypothetical protein